MLAIIEQICSQSASKPRLAPRAQGAGGLPLPSPVLSRTSPMSFSRHVFEPIPRKHWGKCASFVTSARDLLKTNVCSHTVRVMVSYPSPTSRSGRHLGVWRGGRSGFVRDVVWRLIARAVTLGRPGPESRTRELAENVPLAGSSVPSKARSTLVGMDRIPHLERLVAPASGGSGTGFGRRLRARLAGSSRARS